MVVLLFLPSAAVSFWLLIINFEAEPVSWKQVTTAYQADALVLTIGKHFETSNRVAVQNVYEKDIS